MKPSELRDKDDAELVELEKSLRDQLVKMRIGKATSKAVNTADFRRIRRDIARIQTIQSERKLGLERS
ncbi:50S ribosomal protein L29 [Pseudenhygromyxa sp. WMMC2535]|uniref:50S ribosomal protein L29 n=1 Tax=Pseudenhygromyxa sp. WMMC2535 TaxID=2712867 RepID=UPI001555FD4F|nr:50S ribosomal protein L29 [Pseudenhygromyxa sp. WMMC2535]NVB36814.1 50S ribosomal protein L29 [Pseudenhygromyxa sp. WMMC2535]